MTARGEGPPGPRHRGPAAVDLLEPKQPTPEDQAEIDAACERLRAARRERLRAREPGPRPPLEKSRQKNRGRPDPDLGKNSHRCALSASEIPTSDHFPVGGLALGRDLLQRSPGAL